MARRLFLHVGTPKSGTTYLQSVLWSNQKALRQQGVLLPLGQFISHFHLSTIARDAQVQLQAMPASGHSSWDRMVKQVTSWKQDALISHELFSYTPPERVRWTVEHLTPLCDELHVVITARDLARQVPAEWQETTKHGGTHRLHEYYEYVRAHDPKVAFWAAQDIVALLRHWGAELPPERTHLVTLPPPGAPTDLLWKRFAGLIGIDPDSVDTSVSRPNESLGLVEIETLRRCNEHAPKDVPRHVRNTLTRQVFAEGILAKREGAERFAPSPEDHAWAVKAGNEIVDTIAELPYDVVGDIDDLRPNPEPVQAPSPDDVSDADVARVAVETLPTMLFNLGGALRESRQAVQFERDIPLKIHVRRRLGRVKRAVQARLGR